VNTLALPALQRKPAHRPSIAECLVLAALLHLLAVALLGNTPGGSAQPGQGVWGTLNVRLAGPAEARPGPEAARPPEAYTGPRGQARERRWGGRVRSAPTPPHAATDAGAARLGTWRRTPSVRDLDPLPEAPAPLPVQQDSALALPPALPERLPTPLALPPRAATVHTLKVPALPAAPDAQAPLPATPQSLPALPAPVSPQTVQTLQPLRSFATLPAPTASALQNAAPLNASAPTLPALALPPALPNVAAPAPRPAPLPAPARTQTLRAAPAPALQSAPPLSASPSTLPPLAMPQPLPGVAAPAPVVTRALHAPAAAPVVPAEPPLPAGPAAIAALPEMTPAAEPAPLPPVTRTLAATPTPLSSSLSPSISAQALPPTPALEPLAPLAPLARLPQVGSDLPALASPTRPATPLAGSTPRPAFGNPDAGAMLGHDVATPPSAAASAPRLNLQLPHSRGGEISPLGASGGLFKMLPHPPEHESKLAEDIKKAARPDCRTAYGGLGLLAVVPLAADAIRKSGCRW